MTLPCRIHTRRFLPLLVALAAGCDSDGGMGPDPAPLVVRVGDPREDTFGTSESEGLVQPDIVLFTITQGSEELVLVLEFADPVEPVRESPNAAAGFIDLDTDRNAATGTPAATDTFRPDEDTGTTGLGVDLGVIVRVDADVFLVDTRTGSRQTLRRADYAGRTITVRVPYDRIGGDGDLNAAAVFGTFPEPTDIVPNSSHMAVQAAGATRIDGSSRAIGPAETSVGEAAAWPPDW